MIERPVVVVNDLGLHLRAAGVLARIAATFECDIQIQRDTHVANAKSIMGLLALAASTHTELKLITNGSDEHAAADRLCALFETGFVDE